MREVAEPPAEGVVSGVADSGRRGRPGVPSPLSILDPRQCCLARSLRQKHALCDAYDPAMPSARGRRPAPHWGQGGAQERVQVVV